MKKLTKRLALILISHFLLSTTNIFAQWQYQREITINSVGSELINFQVLITLTTSNFNYSNAKSDGSDLRFSTASGGGSSANVNHWIEEWNTSGESRIWVKIPSVPASGNTLIYMYYGNNSASNASNGTNTFEFFDDFEDGNDNGWTQDRGTWNIVTDNGNYVYETTHSGSGDNAASITPNYSDLIYEADIKTVSTTDSYGNGAIFIRGGIKGEYDPQINKAKLHHAAVGDIAVVSFVSDHNTWYRVKVKAGGTLLKLFIDNDEKISTTYSGGTSPGIIGLVVWEANARFDNPRVRKYSSTEPSSTVGSETSGSYPLPVELTTFTAVQVDEGILLKWETATEVNNYGFEIERSLVISNEERNLEWEKIGFVTGHGNSSSPKSYEFVDNEPPAGSLQYRLKQIDTDGTFTYYNTIAEVNTGITSAELKKLPTEFSLSQNYPNPFNPSTTISYSIPVVDVPSLPGGLSRYAGQTGVVEGPHVSIKVYDILGNEVATLVDGHKAPGNYNISFDGNYLSSGLYIYKLVTSKQTFTKKMLLLK
jgi:hypothetical protein